MKRKILPITVGVVAGLGYWAVDALLMTLRVPGAVYTNFLLSDVPFMRLLVRAAALGASIIVGVFVSWTWTKLALRSARRRATHDEDPLVEPSDPLAESTDPLVRVTGAFASDGSLVYVDGNPPGREADAAVEADGAPGPTESDASPDDRETSDGAPDPIESDETTDHLDGLWADPAAQVSEASEHDADASPSPEANSAIDELLAPEDDPDRLIQETCEELVAVHRCRTAWIAYVGSDGRFVSVAGSGLEKCLPALTERLRRGALPPCVMRAQLRRELVVTESSAGKCSDCPAREHYDGLTAITARLEHNGRFIGVLSVSVRPRRARDADGRKVFQEVAAALSATLGNTASTARPPRAEGTTMILARAVAASSGAALATDMDGVLTHVNRAFLSTCSQNDREALLGKDAKHLWASPDDFASVRRAIEETGRWAGELQAMSSDGSPIDMDVAAEVVTDQAGRRLGVIFACRETGDEADAGSPVAQTTAALIEAAATGAATPTSAAGAAETAAVPATTSAGPATPGAGILETGAPHDGAADRIEPSAGSTDASGTARKAGPPSPPSTPSSGATTTPPTRDSQTPGGLERDGIERALREKQKLEKELTQERERAERSLREKQQYERELAEERERAERAIRAKQEIDSELAQTRERATNSDREKQETEQNLNELRESVERARKEKQQYEKELAEERERADRSYGESHEFEEELAQEREKAERAIEEKRDLAEELTGERERAAAAAAKAAKAEHELALERETLQEYLSRHENAEEELGRARADAEELIEARERIQDTLEHEKRRADAATRDLERSRKELTHEREKAEQDLAREGERSERELVHEREKAECRLAHEKESAEREAEERKRIEADLAQARRELENVRAAQESAAEELVREKQRTEKEGEERRHAEEELARKRERVSTLTSEQELMREELSRERERAERELEERQDLEERLTEERREIDTLRAAREAMTEDLARERRRVEAQAEEQRRTQEDLGDEIERTEQMRLELGKLTEELSRVRDRSTEHEDEHRKLEGELSKQKAVAERHLEDLKRVEEELGFERKKAEHYLAESKSVHDSLARERKRTSGFVEHVETPFVALDEDQTISFVNEPACLLLGLAEEEIVGANWFDLYLPESVREAARAEFGRIVAGTLPESEGILAPLAADADGDRVVVWNASVLRNDRGEIAGALYFCSDAADDADDGDPVHLHGIAAQAADGIVATDLDFRIIFANAAAGDIHGVGSESLLGETPQLVTDGGLAEEIRRAIREAVAAGRTWSGVHSVTRADGSVITCDTRIALARDAAGEPSSYVFVQRDVTDSTLGERMLRTVSAAALAVESARAQRDVFEAAWDELRQIGIGITALFVDESNGTVSVRHMQASRDSGGRPSFESEVFQTGLDELAELAAPLRERESEFREDLSGLARRLLGGQPPNVIERVTALIGTGRAVVAPLTVARAPAGVLVVRSNDLTADHLPIASEFATLLGAAWSRAIAVEELERNVSTLELVREQELRASASRPRLILGADTAKEIADQLAQIGGATDLIRSRHGTDDPTRDDLDRIRTAIVHASSLVEELLSGEGESRSPALVEVDVNEIVSGVAVELRRLLGDDVELVTELRPEPASVVAEPAGIEKMVLGLAINARNAMPHGGRFTIRTETVNLDQAQPSADAIGRSGHYVRVTFEDTGEGLEGEALSRIFDSAYESDAVARRAGFGLAEIHAVVTGFEGWIGVQSQRGRGSVFKVYLPTRAEDTPPQAKRSMVPDEGGRILIVEDEEPVRRQAAEALRNYGYTVVEAASAEEALRLFAQHDGEFDLIFSNLVLPVMSGTQLAEQLTGLCPDVPFLLSAGRTDDGPRWSKLEDQGFVMLEKPYDVGELLESVETALTPQ